MARYSLALLITLLLIPHLLCAADINKSASRTTGVAPLSVTFNADLWEASASEQRFHEYIYSWDFGDVESGAWWNDGSNKNNANGGVASHVFETAGVFTVTLTVRNSSTGSIISTEGETFEITVTDPDTVYSGTNTTCIADTIHNDFEGCPSGATQVRLSGTDLQTNLPGYLDAGERVLLHRGSDWQITGAFSLIANTGPTTLGAYGDCSSPDDKGICADAPSITTTNTGNNPIFSMSYLQDMRILDIHLIGSGANSGRAFSGATGNYQNTIARVKTESFSWNVDFSNYRENDTELNKNSQITFYDCEFGPGLNLGMGMFIMGEKISLLGNEFKGGGQHSVRFAYAYIGVIEHNWISGASYNSTYGGSALRIHGPQESQVGDYGATGSSGVAHQNRFIIVANNMFGGSGPWAIELTPENNESDQRNFDLVFEKNVIVTSYGFPSADVDRALRLCGYYYTIRNNVFDGSTTATGSYTAIITYTATSSPAPDYINIYNNTIYRSNISSDAHYGVHVHTGTNITVRNNYASFPNVTSTKQVVFSEVSSTTSNNLLTDNPHFVDPDNVNPLLRDFHLTSASTEAIEQGFETPLLDDFDGGLRTTPYDIGAYEFSAATVVDSVIYSGVTIQ